MFSTDFILNAVSHLSRFSHRRSGFSNAFPRIHTDSRTILKNDFFVPLQGDQFDGHQFIEGALAKGAAGFFYSDPTKLPQTLDPSVLAIEVPSTLEAYRELAKAWRLQFTGLPVIAVAGSVGKTTSKELLTACLRGRFKEVLSTRESQNGFVGVALTLLELRSTHQAAVIEIGIDEPAAMKKHLDVVRPQYSIVTALGPEHLETLKDLETVAIEETEALRFCLLKDESHAALNADEPDLKKYLGITPDSNHALSYGFSSKTSPWSGLEHFSGQDTDHHLKLTQGPWSGETFSNPAHGKHNARNLLGVLALCRLIGLTADEARKGLSMFKAPKGRSDLRTLKNGMKVLADFYNSNPTSLSAALDTFKTIAAPKKIACLGDMLELGPDELTYHANMSKHEAFQNAEIETVLLFGPRMKTLFEELSKIKKLHVQHFTDHQTMAQTLSKQLTPQHGLLIKGSRSMKMETLFKLCPELSEMVQP